jgi:hypothetical protein
MAVTQQTLDGEPTVDGRDSDDKSNIFGCGVPSCDFATNSLISLHGHYFASHHPDSCSNSTPDIERANVMNRFFKSLNTDVKEKSALTLPFNI